MQAAGTQVTVHGVTIVVDTSAIPGENVRVHGLEPNPLPDGQNLQLVPGQHRLYFASGQFADFVVRADATIDVTGAESVLSASNNTLQVISTR